MREKELEVEGQRERETQNPQRAPGSEPSTQSPMWGSNPWTVQDHDLSQSQTLNRVNHPGAPELYYFFKRVNFMACEFLSQLKKEVSNKDSIFH